MIYISLQKHISSHHIKNKKMNKNLGSTDKIVRLVIAAIIIGLFFMDKLPAPWHIVGLVVAGIMLVTSLINFCPLYYPFGIKTNKGTK